MWKNFSEMEVKKWLEKTRGAAMVDKSNIKTTDKRQSQR
jgi:hypothetical protein